MGGSSTAARSFTRTQALVLAAALVASSILLGIVRAHPAAAYPTGPGYWLIAKDGGVFSYGGQFEGSAGSIKLNQPVVGGAAYPFYEGYWFVAADGGVFNYGNAPFKGSAGSIRLNKPVVGMAAHPSGNGYWLVASDGGIFSYGAAKYHGSTATIALNKPIVGMASTPTGKGYFLVASDGGVFNYGDAGYFGSAGNVVLNKPIVGMAATPTGLGYWLVASDGGIFAYGDAKYAGSKGGQVLNKPIVGMTSTTDGKGYWLVASDGGVFNYGTAPYLGSAGSIVLNQPVVGIIARPPLSAKVDPFNADAVGRSQSWTSFAGDYQLALSWDGTGSIPAGARFLGVEGLTVGQLSTLSFKAVTAGCAGSPRFNLYVDTNNDGVVDTNRTYACTGAPTAGATVSFNPLTDSGGLPTGAVVKGLDVLLGSAGTRNLDDITAAGINVTDFRTFRADGTIIG